MVQNTHTGKEKEKENTGCNDWLIARIITAEEGVYISDCSNQSTLDLIGGS